MGITTSPFIASGETNLLWSSVSLLAEARQVLLQVHPPSWLQELVDVTKCDIAGQRLNSDCH